MKPRILGQTILTAVKTFPAIVVTGPRQSGKTTLLKALFPTYRFVSFEPPDIRLRAKTDPLGCLEANPPPVILDEIQYVPDLLSYIKTRIDEHRKPGQWLFTGSQHFSLMHGVSQSLAGRAAVLSLLPFSFPELTDRAEDALDVQGWLRRLQAHRAPARVGTRSVADCLLRGGYPELALHPRVDRQLWCGSYLATYVERDIRQLAQLGELSQFEQFLRLCAIRTGQLLNLSDMARDIGVSVTTAARWLSLLETGYQVFLLRPYYRNLGKRLVKRPKLYVTDTALASYFLGIHDRETLLNSPSFGHLFETLIVIECWKRYAHAGQLPSLFYLRTRDGLEVDLVVEDGRGLHLFEITSTMTVTPHHAASLARLLRDQAVPAVMAAVVSRSEGNFPLTKQVTHVNWRHFIGV